MVAYAYILIISMSSSKMLHFYSLNTSGMVQLFGNSSTVVCRINGMHQAGIGGGLEVFVAWNVFIALLFLATSYSRAAAHLCLML